MTQLSYLICISRAETATALHELRHESLQDGDLTHKEVQEIAGAIGRRFALQAVGQPVPRWAPRGAAITKPIRIPAATHAK